MGLTPISGSFHSLSYGLGYLCPSEIPTRDFHSLTVLGICVHLKSLPEILTVYLTVLGICVHLKSLPDDNLKEGRLPPSLSAPPGPHMLKVFRIYLLIHQLDG